ncbi:hypothetical protein, partial [Candidatus Ichthyocystis sparus]|uniref:hypothetical protein n=1 Tax=Candidatus Ichthyocystis sparus TaxID=1561004 RepID=UPI00159EBA85
HVQLDPGLLSQPEPELLPQPEPGLLPQPEPELPPQPEPVLLFQLDPGLLSGAVGTYLFLVIEPTVPSESSLTIGDVVLVSTAEGVAPGLGVLGSELSVSSHVQLDPGLLSQPEPGLLPQPEPGLLPQPEPGLLPQPELLSEAVGSSFSPIESIAASVVPNESSLTIDDVVLVSTAEGVAPGLGVLGSELSVSSHVQLDPGLLSQPEPELLPQPEPGLLPQPEPGLSSEPELLSEAVGSSFSPIESIAASVVPNESSLTIGDVVLVSTAEGVAPGLGVLGSELSVPSPIQLEPGLSPQPEPEPESLYGAIGSPLSVSSPVSLSEPAPLFLPSSESRSVSDISSASLSTEEVGFRSATIV